jgi:hypothetical protein
MCRDNFRSNANTKKHKKALKLDEMQILLNKKKSGFISDEDFMVQMAEYLKKPS